MQTKIFQIQCGNIENYLDMAIVGFAWKADCQFIQEQDPAQINLVKFTSSVIFQFVDQKIVDLQHAFPFDIFGVRQILPMHKFGG